MAMYGGAGWTGRQRSSRSRTRRPQRNIPTPPGGTSDAAGVPYTPESNYPVAGPYQDVPLPESPFKPEYKPEPTPETRRAELPPTETPPVKTAPPGPSTGMDVVPPVKTTPTGPTPPMQTVPPPALPPAPVVPTPTFEDQRFVGTEGAQLNWRKSNPMQFWNPAMTGGGPQRNFIQSIPMVAGGQMPLPRWLRADRKFGYAFMNINKLINMRGVNDPHTQRMIRGLQQRIQEAWNAYNPNVVSRTQAGAA